MGKADKIRAEKGLIHRGGKLVQKEVRCPVCNGFVPPGSRLCDECARVVRVLRWLQKAQQPTGSPILIPKPGMADKAIEEAIRIGRRSS